MDITECPSLYEQADVMFQPTLLECFSATYPEAMKMQRPIVTTDIEFAHGLCGPAAHYYSPLSAEDAARAEGFVGTDDASLVERAGGRVLCVECPRDNLKVTLPEDLPLVEFLLNEKLRG